MKKNLLTNVKEKGYLAMACYEANKDKFEVFQKRASILTLMLTASLLSYGQGSGTTTQEVTQIANIIIGAFSTICVLGLILVGVKAWGKFTNNEAKEGSAYIIGGIVGIIVWIVVVKNARSIAQFTNIRM